MQHVHVAALEGWLTCNFRHVYMDSFRDTRFLNLSRHTAPLVECLDKYYFLPRYRSIRMCVQKLRTLCKNSTLRIIKTIRTPASMTASLSKQINNFKVLHLVRDPRSVVWSQILRQTCDPSIPGLYKCAKTYCDKALENMDFLNSELPDSHLTVRYEDIASKPVSSVKRMYDFLGLTLTSDMAKFAHEVTLGGNHSECFVCRQRWQMSNTSDTSDKRLNTWSNLLPIRVIRALEKPCLDFMEKFRYERVGNTSSSNRTYFT